MASSWFCILRLTLWQFTSEYYSCLIFLPVVTMSKTVTVYCKIGLNFQKARDQGLWKKYVSNSGTTWTGIFPLFYTDRQILAALEILRLPVHHRLNILWMALWLSDSYVRESSTVLSEPDVRNLTRLTHISYRHAYMYIGLVQVAYLTVTIFVTMEKWGNEFNLSDQPYMHWNMNTIDTQSPTFRSLMMALKKYRNV